MNASNRLKESNLLSNLLIDHCSTIELDLSLEEVGLDPAAFSDNLPLIYIPLVNQITHHIPRFIYKQVRTLFFEKYQKK